MIPLVDGIPPIAGKPGHPVSRPDELYADRAYDSDLIEINFVNAALNHICLAAIKNMEADLGFIAGCPSERSDGFTTFDG